MVLIGIIISIIIIVGIFFLYLFIGFSSEYSSTISVNSLDEKPDKYVIITSNQLNKWPLLKKAILSESYIEVPYEEQDQLEDMADYFIEKLTFNFKYNNTYYKVRFLSS